jgi:hypothetical protein
MRIEVGTVEGSGVKEIYIDGFRVELVTMIDTEKLEYRLYLRNIGLPVWQEETRKASYIGVDLNSGRVDIKS